MTDLRLDEPSPELLEQEAIIEEGLETFFDVGMALRKIRNEGLFVSRGVETFEVYLQKRWHPQLSRSRASYLIEAARTQEALFSNENKHALPVTEGAMRPLAELMPVDPEYAEARDTGRPATLKEVERVIELVAADPRVDEKHPPTDKIIAEHVKTVRLEMRPGTTERGNEPGKPVDPYVKTGDLYAVGPHWVLCGDSSDPDVLRRALGDQPPHLLFTDPPYGVDYEGKTEEALTIENDESEEIALDVFAALKGLLPPGTPYYVCSPAGDMEYAMRDAVKLLGSLRQSIVWAKDVMVMGRQDYQWKHELLMYGWVDGAAHSWYGRRDKVTVWEIDRPKVSREHPTMKPLELMAEAIRNSTVEGDVVFDPFLGSGSTLVAAAQLGRIGVGVELDPAYAQVAISRLENELQTKAVLLTS